MATTARRLASVVLTTLVALLVAAPVASAATPAGDALALLNSERAAAGLAPVAMHADLVDDALAWSQHMRAQGSLSHNPNLSEVSDDWRRLGENVGVGPSISSLHSAFMNSPGHRGNILGDYDYVGIAVVEETSSKLWITVVFMKSLDAEPVVADNADPEPYSEVQPAVDSDQPAANPATAPAEKVAAAPAPRANVVFVQAGVSPLAD